MGAVTELRYPEIVLVEWEDATNISNWVDLADIAEWASDGDYVCRSVGYLVHEDDDCVVLAARVGLAGEPEQVGLFERIPKPMITLRWTLSAKRKL